MTMVVCKNFFYIFCPYYQFKLLKTVTFRLEFILSFYKNVLDQTWNSCSTKFGPQWKDQKRSYHVRQILTLFCKSIALILGYNCVKDPKATKIVKHTKFEVTWGELEAKNCFKRQYLKFSFAYYVLNKCSNW